MVVESILAAINFTVAIEVGKLYVARFNRTAAKIRGYLRLVGVILDLIFSLEEAKLGVTPDFTYLMAHII